MNSKIIDLRNKSYGRLTVLNSEPKKIDGKYYWLCKCNCKNLSEKWILGDRLRRGITKSCGCLSSELSRIKSFIHGQSETKTYYSWSSMIGRCYDEKNKSFPIYGGRGIKVCESWHKFENFYKDLGSKPEDKTLDRIDTDDDYYKENCRWATRKEQAQNRRNSIYLTYDNQTKPLIEWARELSLSYEVLRRRYRRGWPSEKVLGFIKHPAGSYRYYVTYNNEKLPLKEWSKKLNIPLSTLWNRIVVLKWDIEKCFRTPCKHIIKNK